MLRLSTFLLTLLLAACGGTPAAPGAPGASDDGWTTLFDGETLGGWHAFNGGAPADGWRVEDGTLHFAPGAEGGDIFADGVYGDFELELEWKVAPCGNSGIFYRGAERPDVDFIWRTGLEMQVLDDACHPDARFPSHRAGALYDLYTPSDLSAVRPGGEWNRARIVARGARVEHWLNGVKVVEFDQGGDAWDVRVAASKFRDAETFPGFGTHTEGPLGLQDHGDPVWYRDIRVRRL